MLDSGLEIDIDDSQLTLDFDIKKSNLVSQSVDSTSRTEVLTILHSGLFTAANATTPRKSFDGENIPVAPGAEYKLKFTGIELRVLDDEDVWINIIHYARKQKVHNTGFTINIKTSEFMRTMEWGTAGSDYKKLRDSLRRLRSASIEVNNSEGDGFSFPSFIRQYSVGRKGNLSKLIIVLEPEIYKLYCTTTTGTISFRSRQSLSTFEKKIYSLIVGNTKQMHLSEWEKLSGVKYAQLRQFKARLKKALDNIKNEGLIKSYSIGKDNILNIEGNGNLKNQYKSISN